MNNIDTNTPAGLPAPEHGTVQDLQLAKTLGYSRPANIRNLIKRNLTVLASLGIVASREASILSGKGRVSATTEYHLNRQQAAFLAARSNTKRGAVATAYMVEVEALFHAGYLVVADNAKAQAAFDAAAERDRERRHQLMRAEKDDYSRIVGSFSRAPSRRVIGTASDGTPILSELTPFEQRKAREKGARRRR